MKRILRIVVVLVVLAIVAGAGYWIYQTRFAPPPAAQSFTQIVPVREGRLSNSLSVVGELDPEQSADLVFSLMDGAAELKTLNVAAGNTVQAGQVLATIDPKPYQQALEQAKSDLDAAQKTLADLQAPATQLEIAQADLAIAQADYQIKEANNTLNDLEHPDLAALQSAFDQAQADLAKAQADLLDKQNDKDAAKNIYDLQVAEATPAAQYNRLAAETYSDEFYQDRLRVAYNAMMDAADTRASAEIEQQQAVQSAEKAVRTAERAVSDAQKALTDAQAGGNALDLTSAKLAVQTAQVALAKAQDDRKQLDAGADATALATAQADVTAKQLAVTEAEKALAATELKAPFDGTVLQTNAKQGDEITASTVVLALADLSQLNVVALVDETTIRRIRQGQDANISFDAFPGQTFQGKVLSVPLQGELQNDVMVYEVPLSISGVENLPVRVGMTANVSIETAQADNALLVPTLALQRVRGGYQIAVVDPNNPTATPVLVPVEVGLSDGTYTQIVQGLQPGDQVVVTYQAVENQNNPFFRAGGVFGGGGAFPGGGFGGGNRQPGQNRGGGNTRP